MPIFCLSPLAIHARNLIEDPRCSLVVQMPGWTGLANARVTIFGDTYQLPADMQVSSGSSSCSAGHASDGLSGS
jgi:putative heme iron utilization protein